MENEFTDIMKKHSDEELLEITTRLKNILIRACLILVGS